MKNEEYNALQTDEPAATFFETPSTLFLMPQFPIVNYQLSINYIPFSFASFHQASISSSVISFSLRPSLSAFSSM